MLVLNTSGEQFIHFSTKAVSFWELSSYRLWTKHPIHFNSFPSANPFQSLSRCQPNFRSQPVYIKGPNFIRLTVIIWMGFPSIFEKPAGNSQFLFKSFSQALALVLRNTSGAGHCWHSWCCTRPSKSAATKASKIWPHPMLWLPLKSSKLHHHFGNITSQIIYH